MHFVKRLVNYIKYVPNSYRYLISCLDGGRIEESSVERERVS